MVVFIVDKEHLEASESADRKVITYGMVENASVKEAVQLLRKRCQPKGG